MFYKGISCEALTSDSGGRAVQEYATALSKDGSRIECWIESQDDQQFWVKVNTSKWNYGGNIVTTCSVRVDGIYVNGIILRDHSRSGYDVKHRVEGSRSTDGVGNLTRRELIFAPVQEGTYKNHSYPSKPH